jgi:glycosyltransferase involved in cell wall biosynthesis
VRHVISPSAFCAEKVFGFAGAGFRAPALSVIPNGTDYAAASPLKGDWAADRFRVLYLGALFEHKGFPVFKSVIERVNAAPNRFEFEIGGAGPLEPEARALAAKYPNVRFHGFVGGEAKHRLFREAHLFFFPSVWLENNPVSITEALAIGLPVLGSDTGGVPELLRPLSNGLLFPPGSIEAAYGKLIAFETDRSSLEKVSRDLLARRDEYSLSRQVDRLCEVYGNVARSA